MSHISLKGNSYKYCTCDTVGPVPSVAVAIHSLLCLIRWDRHSTQRQHHRHLSSKRGSEPPSPLSLSHNDFVVRGYFFYLFLFYFFQLTNSPFFRYLMMTTVTNHEVCYDVVMRRCTITTRFPRPPSALPPPPTGNESRRLIGRFLLTARRGFKWAASTRPGPNDVSHVVWAISKFDEMRRAWVGGVDENGPKRRILRRLGH